MKEQVMCKQAKEYATGIVIGPEVVLAGP